MDRICLWIERVAHWLAHADVPAIPWAGFIHSGFANPPAPHLEFTFAVRGSVSALRLGERVETLPEGHVSLHSVHFGNYAVDPEERTDSWCLFLDVSRAPVFDVLQETPLFCCMPVRRRDELAAAFGRVSAACKMPSQRPGGYITGPPAYEPSVAHQYGSVPHLRVKAALLSFFAFLLEEAGRCGEDPAGAVPEPIQQALTYLHQQYADADLDLRAAARAAHLSVDHFGRTFRAACGLTPMHYLRRLRVQQSTFLLAHTEMRIEEIALQVGYKDPYHFSRVFRQAEGLSPTAFREKHRRP